MDGMKMDRGLCCTLDNSYSTSHVESYPSTSLVWSTHCDEKSVGQLMNARKLCLCYPVCAQFFLIAHWEFSLL
ncbi:hypothetical protein KIN20_028041 [Parelaphostrongylus tenuis]|uniref:Uncharacterized protein n=1 Tax=Parelaphostrongylus tenuis TaxID=148309 RepID=A0AAD5R057_PARTN|nr:hypothetical protein KIN20_028041 [Parelaphostrongylus tenuis]